MAASGLLLLTTAPASAAIDPCGPQGNPITCENSKPGTPEEDWDIYRAGDDSIQGFSTDISVEPGGTIDFKIDTDASSYTVDIYRIGYYDGDGARHIASVTPSATLPQHQPACITDEDTDLYDCGNWAVSASWNVPSSAVSGVYIAKLERSNGDRSHITFVVRKNASTADVVFQTADTTWQAYNTYGGASFYQGGSRGRALKLSYNRPVLTRNGIGGRDFFFSNEYPLVRFLEKNGYDTTYISGVDAHRFGNTLTQHKVYLSVGHDEYWSGQQRDNVLAARDAGVNLQFLAGNEMYWRIRYENSADGSNTPYRTMTSYKETWGNAKIDPSPEWTGTWRDPRYASAANGGGSPENELIGTMYMVNFSDLALQVSAYEGKHRLWRNTPLASMTPGSTDTLAPHTIGYESNEDVDNGFRPPGLARLSTTIGEVPEYLMDFGNTVEPGSTKHHLTLYRASSGALVFSAGSVQWTWGLDSDHDSPFDPEPADPRMQQAQVNLFADMDVQPATLDSGLTATTKSTDTAAPTVGITSPAAGSATPNGTKVTFTGTASDQGGGQVAAVEFSTDGGDTWRPADGTASWTFSYIQKGSGSLPVKVRAVDDSANIGTAATRDLAVSCPCSVFGSEVPRTPTTDDSSPVELGQRIAVERDGFITGVRFYKGANNTGTHTGSLWSTTGERLATGTFTDESATGWQELTFGVPVPVREGEVVVASYSAPNGGYASEVDQFAIRRTDAGPLSVDGGFGATPAGVYGTFGTFPNESWRGTGYYVDTLFSTVDESPLTAGNHWPLPGSSSVAADTTVSAKLSKPATGVTLTVKDALGESIDGTTTYSPANRTATFTPDEPLDGFVEHTATIAATDPQGQSISSGATWSFTTAKPDPAEGMCPCSLFSDSAVPSVLEAADTDAVTLGVRFVSNNAGTVTGVKFYKGPNNNGTHTGALWAMDGTKLAEGTFADESTSGWQTLTFDEPVEIAKDTEYIASYRTTVGRYSTTVSGFPVTRGPLRTVANSGAYTYGAGFPSNASTTNYYVDVVFEQETPTLAISAQDPAPGALGVDPRAAVTAEFTAPVTSGVLEVEADGDAVAGISKRSPDGSRITFTPSSALPLDTVITVTLSGVAGGAGTSIPTTTWTYRTAAEDIVGSAQTLFGDQVPDQSTTADASPVELGVAFTPSKNGKVTGIRFFKGAGNGGTHTGSLWDASGTRLGNVTFTNESASGWQTAKLSSPVSVQAGQTYVASYYAPQGHYALTSDFFAQAHTSGDLSAPGGAANGRYLYGTGGGMPIYSWNSANYFVDVTFVADPPTLAVTSTSPQNGAANVPTDAEPTITFSNPVTEDTTMAVSANGSPLTGEVSRSMGERTLTFTPAGTLPAGTSINVSVTQIASVEGAVLPDESWTFATENDPRPTASLFAGVTPENTVTGDDAVELGTAFSVSESAEATAVKFYKVSGDTGTHTGSLWSANGDLLGQVTFTDESGSGWQRATFDTPIPLSTGTTYVVSYHSPNGRYAITPQFFSSAWTAGILTAPGIQNGRYRYGSTSGYPNSWWNATNYFVDVVVRPTGG